MDNQEKVRTLYVRKMPRRPLNKEHYIKQFLRCVNPDNKYVRNSHLRVPTSLHYKQYDKSNHLVAEKMLDEAIGLVAMSVSKSSKLRNQCFLTFTSHSAAQNFSERCKETTLKVGGRAVEIDFAKKDSLLGLYFRDQNLLNRVLKNKSKREELHDDPEKLKEHQLKRKLRRLRSKLRTRGESEDNIRQAEAKILTQYEPKLDIDTQISPSKTKPLPKKEIPVNPPHFILLATNLPKDITVDSIKRIIPVVGLKEIRLVSIRCVAFIEYESIEAAQTALATVGSTLKCPGGKANLTYAKK